MEEEAASRARDRVPLEQFFGVLDSFSELVAKIYDHSEFFGRKRELSPVLPMDARLGVGQVDGSQSSGDDDEDDDDSSSEATDLHKVFLIRELETLRLKMRHLEAQAGNQRSLSTEDSRYLRDYEHYDLQTDRGNNAGDEGYENVNIERQEDSGQSNQDFTDNAQNVSAEIAGGDHHDVSEHEHRDSEVASLPQYFPFTTGEYQPIHQSSEAVGDSSSLRPAELDQNNTEQESENPWQGRLRTLRTTAERDVARKETNRRASARYRQKKQAEKEALPWCGQHQFNRNPPKEW